MYIIANFFEPLFYGAVTVQELFWSFAEFIQTPPDALFFLETCSNPDIWNS